MKRRRRKRWFFVAACLVGLAGALLCMMEPPSLGAAPASRTIQVWPDRSLGFASGLWEPSAVPTPTQVLPLGVSRDASGDVVRARTYLHFPQDVFPPGTEILHATLYMYVDSTAGSEQQATIGAYRVLDPWSETDGSADPAAWPQVLTSPIAVTTARATAGSPPRPITSLSQTPPPPVGEASSLFSKPPGHGLLQETRIALDPPNVEMAVGDTKVVDIRIENVSDLYYAEVYLTFDPAVLEVVDAEPNLDGVQIRAGSFLGRDFEENIVAPAIGEIVFSQTADDEPLTGTGILATITFRGKATGATDLQFDTVILEDVDGEFMGVDIEDGSAVVTGQDSPLPTPPTSPLPTSTAIPPTPTVATPTSTPGATPGATPGTTPMPTPLATPRPGVTVPAPPTASGVELMPVAGTWLTWDVTALVRAWLAGEVSDDGLALASAPEPNADPETAGDLLFARCLSADNPDTRPHLIVGFEVSPATPTPPPGLPPAGGANGRRATGVVLIGAAVVLMGLATRRRSGTIR